MQGVPDSPEERRKFVPDDPTQDQSFDPSKWAGTIMSGLVSSRSECGECWAEWVDGHECPA
jgi:hypothetical protein